MENLLDLSNDQLVDLFPCRARRHFRGLRRKHLALLKKLRKHPARTILVVGAFALLTTLVLRRKSLSLVPDPAVEDFNSNQERMLSRIREIWAEYSTGVA